jgi:hypothetical protein
MLSSEVGEVSELSTTVWGSTPFGNPNFDSAYGGAHDLDIGAPPNYEVTALLPGTILTITDGKDPAGDAVWGRQVGLRLDQPYKGIPNMAYLHLSAVNPQLREHPPSHVSKGDTIGWVGGGSFPEAYGDTTNPTGKNFLNTSSRSSRIQVGVALMRGPEYGNTEFHKWQPVGPTPVERELDPTQIILDARREFEGGDMLQITDPFAAEHFTQVAEDRWHCSSTHVDVALGILGFYRRIGGAPRLPLTGEQHDPEHDVTYQVFEAGVIVFDPNHKLDHPTGFESSYLLKLDSDLAKKILHIP